MTKPAPATAELPSGGVCTLRSSSGVGDSATRITTIELRLYVERPLADIVIAGDPLSWYLHGPMFAPLFAIDVDTGLRLAAQPRPGSEWEAVLFEQATVNGAVLTNHLNFKSRALGHDAGGGHQFDYSLNRSLGLRAFGMLFPTGLDVDEGYIRIQRQGAGWELLGVKRIRFKTGHALFDGLLNWLAPISSRRAMTGFARGCLKTLLSKTS